MNASISTSEVNKAIGHFSLVHADVCFSISLDICNLVPYLFGPIAKYSYGFSGDSIEVNINPTFLALDRNFSYLKIIDDSYISISFLVSTKSTTQKCSVQRSEGELVRHLIIRTTASNISHISDFFGIFYDVIK